MATDTISMKKYSLAEYLSPGMILANLAAKSKEGVIKRAFDGSVAGSKIASFDEAWAAIWERERACRQGWNSESRFRMREPIVSPNPVCAIGIKHEGLDFDSIDANRHRFFVPYPDAEIQTLAFFCSFYRRSADFERRCKRGQLLDAKDAQEIFQIMTHSGENAAKK